MDQALYYGPLVLSMIAAGLVGGFVAGMFGIGGGFVIVPALTAVLTIFSQGDPKHVVHVAIGTSLATIFFTSLRSVRAHAKKGVVDWGILKSWFAPVAVGVVIGIALTSFMDSSQLKIIFGLFALPIGLHFLFPFLASKTASEERMPKGIARAGIGTGLGIMSSFLGIGGGTPAVLLMTLSGVSMHRAVGTAAGFGTVIAIPGAIGSILVGLGQTGLPIGSVGYVNLIGLIAITPMTVLMAPVGAAAAHRLNGVHLRKFFGAYLVLTAFLMMKDPVMAFFTHA